MTSADQSAIIDTLADSTVTDTAYYTLQGIRTANPSAGTLYIVRDTYSNGEVKTSKRIY